MPTYILVITTCAGYEEAARLAVQLVEARLAACVQLSQIESIYRWTGAVETAREQRLLIKARNADYAAIETFLRARHSYENPEILAIPVLEGSAAYLDWIDTETTRMTT